MKPKKSDEKLAASRNFEQKWLHMMRRPQTSSANDAPPHQVQNLIQSDEETPSIATPISASGDSFSSEQTVKFLQSSRSRSSAPQDTFHFASDSSDYSDSDSHIQESNGTLKNSPSYSSSSINTATNLAESGEVPLEPVPVMTATLTSALKEPTQGPRSRAGSRTSKSSIISHMSTSNGDEALRKRLGKFVFWNRSSSQDHSYEKPYGINATDKPASSNQQQASQPVESQNYQSRLHSNSVGSSNKVYLGPPITIPPKRGSPVVPASSSATTSADIGTVPFPAKRESSNGSSSFSDLPRLFFDSEARNRKRKNEESGVRSRSSSLGLNYHSYAHHQRQVPGVSNGSMGAIPSTSPITSCSSPGVAGVGCQDCSEAGCNRPPALLRRSSNDDVRFRRVLPLPPPPTIGTGNVLDDPDVKALHLDPMAVRYADLLHMLGYTRNRYVCALLARESSKDGSRYNGMVMQAFVMRMLRFHGEPLDMSLRKFLFKMALAQESQQIERQLQSFSTLWNYQNPGFFTDEEHVLCVVYSLVMLHTATFNKNVKQKMSKADFVRNAPLDGVAPEIFEYFYDNITATSFKAEDENAMSTTPSVSASTYLAGGTSTPMNQQLSAPFMSPMASSRSPSMASNPDFSGEDLVPPHIGQVSSSSHESPNATSTFSNNGEDSLSVGSRRSSSFIWSREQFTDPYPYLLENRLDSLRATLPSVSVSFRLKFCALETAEELHTIRTQLEDYSGVSLQIASGRSKTDTQEVQNTVGSSSNNSSGSTGGIGSKPALVDIPVVKHGVVLRREYKRTLGVGELKPAWREWGLVLTTSKLYFFKNASWIRQLDGSAKKVPVSYDTLHSTKAVSTRDVAALVKVVQNSTPRTSQSSSTSGHSTYAMSTASTAISLTTGENVNRTASNMSPSSVNFRPRRTTSSPPLSTEATLSNVSDVPHHEVGPHGTEVFDFMLVEGGRDTAQQCFAVSAKEELISWVRSINVIATQSSLNIGLLPSLPATTDQVKSAIDDVNEQIEAAKSDVTRYQRTLEHFQMLAPLHQRTRERLVFTAGRYTSRLDDSLAEIARLQAYSNILSFMEYA